MQTSGVGLNITEANHVLFLDRWFNPTIHDQAMDRTHRYGQKKPVEVTFLDCEDSVDKVMRIIDEYKSQNAKVATANEGDLPGLAALGGLGADAGPAAVLGTDLLRRRPRMWYTASRVFL